tara:strand:- start:3271 stop:3486 length:216 start_codon:yes stop_codon:yes gene_type:complete
MNHNCKVCKTPMKRDMRNVKSRDYSKVINWLGICSKECMNKLKDEEVSEMLLDGNLSYLMDIQRQLSTKPQ